MKGDKDSGLTIVVLSGGQSKRFRHGNKLLFDIDGQPMFLVVYNKFKPFANEIFLQGLFVKKERIADDQHPGGIVIAQPQVKLQYLW